MVKTLIDKLDISSLEDLAGRDTTANPTLKDDDAPEQPSSMSRVQIARILL